MVGTQEEINAQVQKFKNILDGEVLQIEESMDKTNQLLERKFDEFTELLKKSNTEALVSDEESDRGIPKTDELAY